jgi:hypothetical protein
MEIKMTEVLHLSATPSPPLLPIRENVAVTAVRFHHKAALAFADSVAHATEAQAEFGIKLEPQFEPSGAADLKIVRVIGYTKGKLLPGENNFHVGNVARRVVSDIARRVAAGEQVEAKLRAIEFESSPAAGAKGLGILIDIYAGIASTEIIGSPEISPANVGN